MLKKLQKYFAGDTAQLASAENQEELQEMTEQEIKAMVDTATATLSAELATASDKYTKLATEFAGVTAKLSAMETAKAADAEAAKTKLATARKDKLEAILGTDKAPAVLAALEGLDEAAFSAVVGSMETTMKVEKESTMFKEAGVDGAVKAEAPGVVESAEMKLIRAQIAAEAAQQ